MRAQGPPPDEGIYNGARRAHGRTRTATSTSPRYDLYDTTGTTEDWSYYATGGLGYTFEIGCERVPPAVRGVRSDEYVGAGAYAGKGNREAFFIAMENAADASKHSVIAGTGPAGAQLRLRKAFVTETSPVRTMSNGVVTIDEVENDAGQPGPAAAGSSTCSTRG